MLENKTIMKRILIGTMLFTITFIACNKNDGEPAVPSNQSNNNNNNNSSYNWDELKQLQGVYYYEGWLKPLEDPNSGDTIYGSNITFNPDGSCEFNRIMIIDNNFYSDTVLGSYKFDTKRFELKSSYSHYLVDMWQTNTYDSSFEKMRFTSTSNPNLRLLLQKY